MPRRSELRESKGITQKMIERNFGSFREAFEAAGLETRGAGYTLTKDQIFDDWARVVRKIGRIPTVVEFQMHNLKTGIRAYRMWFGNWLKVPKGLLKYAEERGLEGEWSDVLEITREHCRKELVTKMKPKTITESTQVPRINEEWPLYGAPLATPSLPLIYAPRNEAGVLVLFGALALRLGFMILWVGTAFPDVEAIREVQKGLWQRKRIEIEFQSRNFLDHGHDPEGCDLIVCWEDNWRESPVEVLELRRTVKSGDPVTG